MNDRKRISILLLLLLLVLIVCTWCHIQKRKTVLKEKFPPDKKAVLIPQKTIEFLLEKEQNTFELSGHFLHEENIEKIKSALGMKKLIHHEIIDESRTVENNIIQLTQEIIPIFTEKYSKGSILYKNNQLIVSGIVGSREDKNTISTLLANSTISSKNNTIIHFIPTEPLEFKIDKKENNFTIEGKFASQKDLQILSDKIDTSILNKNVIIDKKTISNRDILDKTTKLLTIFTTRYKEGFIQYKDKILTVEGSVQSHEDKIDMQILLDEFNVKYIHRTEILLPPQSEIKKEKKSSSSKEEIGKKIQNIITFEHIDFKENTAILVEMSMQTIRKISEVLNANPDIKVDIEGHTDDSKEHEYNIKLSQERVESIKRALIGLGISSERMRTIGYGESHPLVSNDTKENRRINRRIEFKIKGE